MRLGTIEFTKFYNFDFNCTFLLINLLIYQFVQFKSELKIF